MHTSIQHKPRAYLSSVNGEFIIFLSMINSILGVCIRVHTLVYTCAYISAKHLRMRARVQHCESIETHFRNQLNRKTTTHYRTPINTSYSWSI